MAGRRIEHKTSQTACYTCFTRACANKEPDKRFRGPDGMAQVFLPLGAKLFLNVKFLRTLFMNKLTPPGIYEYVLARTKVIDEIFLFALRTVSPK